MQQLKRIVIVAGEESGDKHAASCVRALKQRHPDLHVSGIGGQHMQDAGVELISDLARFGVTGILEVIRHVRVIRRAFLDIKAHLQAQKPDLLILVDYPGFNLRLAKFAKHALGIRVIYYISPQIWAWKANRIHTIRACVDKMAVILPFEKALYEHANIPVAFVGHPLVDKLHLDHDVAVLKSTLGLPAEKRLIAMLPGSRLNEIKHLMPILRDTALQLITQLPNLHVIIPVARTIHPALIEAYLINTTLPYTLIKEQAMETLYCCDAAIVASGTASLECALLAKPMCIVYKGSWVSYVAAFKLIRVKFLGLCNVLQNQMIVPELLQYDCNPHELSRTIMALLTNPDLSQRMITRLHDLHHTLSTQHADMTIEALIEHELFA